MAPRWLVLGLGALTFLVAAKAHGRQIRLERQLAGHWHVTFGAQNPAFVEELWRRERLYFWSLVAVFVLATIGFRLLAPRFSWQLPSLLFLHVLLPLIVAFVATGSMSLVRFVLASRSAQPEQWLTQAAWGSAGWWLLTIALGAALSFLACRSA